MTYDWNRERIEAMKNLRRAGYSLAEIRGRMVKRFGDKLSTSAIQGKLYRLGIYNDARPVYVVGHDGEAITVGTKKGQTVERALRMLNKDLAHGDIRFSRAEVERMTVKTTDPEQWRTV